MDRGAFSPASGDSPLSTHQPAQVWWLLALAAAVIACSTAIPLSAAARGILRVGAVTVPAEQQRTRPLLVLGGPVRIDGSTTAPVVVAGGRALVDGNASDDLITLGGDILLGPRSHARGNAIAFGGRVLEADGASVTGSIVGRRTSWSAAELVPREASLGYLVQRLRLAGLAITALLLLGLAVWTVLPWPALVTTATARRFRVRSALLGVGTLFWAPLIVAPLAVSLAGLPLAVLLVLGLGALWLIGVVSTAVRLGHRLLSLAGRRHSLLSATLAGLVCLGLLPALPVIGSLALLLAGCIGLGAALVAVWDREAASDLAVSQALSTISLTD